MRRTHRLPAKSIRCTSICLWLGFISLSVALIMTAAGSSAITAQEQNGQRGAKPKRVPAKPLQPETPTIILPDLDHVEWLLGKSRVSTLAHPTFRFLGLKFSRVRSDAASEAAAARHVSDRMSVDFLTPPVPQAGSSKIVFATNRDGSMQIYTMNADGSGMTRLTNSSGNDDFPRWSPNGSKILFQSDRDHPETGNSDVYVMNFDGSGVTRLTNDPNDDSVASWSGDGTKIVFQSMRNGVNYQVYSMNADGSNQINLTNTSANDGAPSWSPDGSKIAFASDRDHAGYDSVYVMNSNGSSQQRLTFSASTVGDSQPRWSPDGNKIAFVSTRDSVLEQWQETDDFEIPEDDGQVISKSRLHINKEVYVMNADGSSQTRLTNELANDDSPSWSPDGSKIVFRSDRERDCCDPSSQVWSMNADGTNQINLSNSGNNDYSASVTTDVPNNDTQLASDYAGGGNQPPVANAGGSYVAETGQSVQLNGAGSFDPDGSIVNYSWNFGDGTSGTGSIVNHHYSAPGLYPVSLAVTDNNGNTTSAQGFVTIDAVALPVKITFDELPDNTVVADQYLNQYGVRFSSANFSRPVHTKRDCGLTCGPVSFPNFISTKPDDIGQVIVTFAQPVSNLVFYAVGVDTLSGTFAIVDLYRNGSVTPTNTFTMNGFFSTTVGFTSGSLNNIDKVVVRNINDALGIGFDDFSFTLPADVKITNPRTSASLNGTTQSSLVGANIVLNAAPTVGAYAGGTYSWSFTGPTYSVTSGSLSSQSITIRPTNTGALTAKITYTRNGLSVSPTVNINVMIPTLTSFWAEQEDDVVLQDALCGSQPFGTTFSLGCIQIPGQDRGIVWHSTSQIPAVTYLSDPAESGIKFVQAANVFRKRRLRGNNQCFTARASDSEFGEAWQLDTDDPYNHPQHPVRYFSEGNSLDMSDHDSPSSLIERTNPTYGPPFSEDARLVRESFETYVIYFTTNPSNRDPAQPIFQRAMGLQDSSYGIQPTPNPYAHLPWSWGGQVVFNWFSTPHSLHYTWDSYTTVGTFSATTTNHLKPMTSNAAGLTWHRCLFDEETSNPIDGSEFYVRQQYVDFLNREPDQDGWNFWRGQITQCVFSQNCDYSKRIDVARAFFYSIEFMGLHPELAGQRGTHAYNEAFVFACYRGFLRREPNAPPDNNWNGFNFWVNKLDSTNPDDGDFKYNEMLRAFVESIEYRTRFGP